MLQSPVPPVVALNLAFISQQGPAHMHELDAFVACDYCKDVGHCFKEMVQEYEAEVALVKDAERQWKTYCSALVVLARKLHHELFSPARNYMAENMPMPAYVSDEHDVAAVAEYLTDAARFLSLIFCKKGHWTETVILQQTLENFLALGERIEQQHALTAFDARKVCIIVQIALAIALQRDIPVKEMIQNHLNHIEQQETFASVRQNVAMDRLFDTTPAPLQAQCVEFALDATVHRFRLPDKGPLGNIPRDLQPDTASGLDAYIGRIRDLQSICETIQGCAHDVIACHDLADYCSGPTAGYVAVRKALNARLEQLVSDAELPSANLLRHLAEQREKALSYTQYIHIMCRPGGEDVGACHCPYQVLDKQIPLQFSGLFNLLPMFESLETYISMEMKTMVESVAEDSPDGLRDMDSKISTQFILEKLGKLYNELHHTNSTPRILHEDKLEKAFKEIFHTVLPAEGSSTSDAAPKRMHMGQAETYSQDIGDAYSWQ